MSNKITKFELMLENNSNDYKSYTFLFTDEKNLELDYYTNTPIKIYSNIFELDSEFSIINFNSDLISGSFIVYLLNSDGKILGEYVLDNNCSSYPIITNSKVSLVIRINGKVIANNIKLSVKKSDYKELADHLNVNALKSNFRLNNNHLKIFENENIRTELFDKNDISFLERIFDAGLYELIPSINTSFSPNAQKLCFICDLIKLEYSSFLNLKAIFKEKNFFYYSLNYFESGFADNIYANSVLSSFFDNLGLSLYSVQDPNVSKVKKRDYKGLLHEKFPEYRNENLIFVDLVIDDFAKDLLKLFENIRGKNKPEERYLINVKINNINSLNFLLKNTLIFKSFCDNSFINFLRSQKHFEYKVLKNSLCLHIRLGDVAPIKYRERIINIFELQRGNYKEGIVFEGNSNSITAKSWFRLENYSVLIKRLREKFGANLKITIVSDGYDFCKSFCNTHDGLELLNNNIENFNATDFRKAIDYCDSILRSLPADNFVLGDSDKDSFLKSCKAILSSNLVVSMSRAFILGVVAAFKNDNYEKLIISSQNVKSLKLLENFNCTVEQAKDDSSILDLILTNAEKFLNTGLTLINLSPYCKIYQSSFSEWSKYKKGNLIDSAKVSNRFSIHTDNEYEPYILLDLSCDVKVENIIIYLRDSYTEKSLPIKIEVSSDLLTWNCLSVIDKFTYGECIDVDSSPIRYVKITRVGFGLLFLSSILINATEKEFLNYKTTFEAKNDLNEGFVLAHSPFYGLGGRLSVLATAFGALMARADLSDIKFFWEENNLLKFPNKINYSDPLITAKLLNFSRKELYSQLIDDYSNPSFRSLSAWTPDITLNDKVVFVSRNDLNRFFYQGEKRASAFQRMYKCIIPSDDVKIARDKILLNLPEIDWSTSLSVHVRHGNGEYYYNKSCVYGVKPPSVESIKHALNYSLNNSNFKIKTIILASDCKAVAEVVNYFAISNGLDFCFISGSIQENGYGCNHNTKLFDISLVDGRKQVIDDDVQSFAEILILAKSNALCGGKSFFFDAILGFSSIEDCNIFNLDNKDRYISIDPSFKVLAQDAINQDALKISSCLRRTGYKLDGLFYKIIDSKEFLFELCFFDVLLFNGSYSDFIDFIEKDEFRSKLLNFRLYI